ncbi:MAG: CPBP family glutamic-type intramembrane protease [Bryobacteraceae bacterium]|jgi:hypothetical protein
MRTAGIPEALAVFAMILAYIWRLRFTHPMFWVIILASLVASHRAHRERAMDLGFRAGNFGDCARRFGPALIGLALALLSTGLLPGTVRPMGFEAAIGSVAFYLPWGLVQQYLLNGYFLKRFDMALSRNAASLTASALFCAAHSPNWFLMMVTPVGAFGAIRIYRRYKNLYFLGFAHATIGFLLFLVVPDSVSHHMRVGPGWYRHF